MSTVLFSGIFPVRWVPDLRYGEPLFNFYAPLPYYLGAAVGLLGFNFIWVAKVLFMLSSILSAMTMYIFCHKLFSKRGAILATALYVYAPYRAVDIYVRGALSEVWAFVFFPLIFYSSLILSQKASLKNISLLALSLAGLFLTHNVTTLMFLPFLGLWWVYLILREKRWMIALYLLLASILGFGLSAFFLLPAFFESAFIQTKYLTVGYFDFRAHFVAFKQFFSLFWGYGSSLWGPKDGMSFQVGLVNWAILVLAGVYGFLFRKEKKLLVLLAFLGLSFFLSVFLQHNKSAFIWEAIPLMAFIQFPWRFLAISIFIVSITGGVVADYFKNKYQIIYFILIASVILVNLGYFRPKEYVDDSFFNKFLHIESMKRGVDLTKDYLPIWVQTIDGERFEIPRAEKGEIKINSFMKTPSSAEGSIQVFTDSVVQLPIFYFPGWGVRTNNQPVKLQLPSKDGLIKFELPKGEYKIEVEFKDTPVRTMGNMISLGSFIFMVGVLMYKRYKLR